MNLDTWTEILRQCRDYLNNQANSAELIFDKSKDNLVDLKSISKVLEELNINQEEYEEFLKIPDDQNCQFLVIKTVNFISNMQLILVL